MAQIGRVAGSLLVESEGKYFLVGYPKEPCAFGEYGLSTPATSEAWPGRSVEIEATGAVQLGGVILQVALEGTALLEVLRARLLIERNGSVSERLWRLVVGADEEGNVSPGVRDADWLVSVPAPLWNLVRDSVLRCS